MKTRIIHRETWVNVSQEEVFSFFANPNNLLLVTDPSIPVEILTDKPIMKKNTVINLKMKLFGFLPVKWQTKISTWNPPQEFIDIQPKGPYKYWKHQHKFTSLENGTLVIDHLEFIVPGFFLEPIIYRLFVKNNLERLFDYRQKIYPKLLEKSSSLPNT